MTSPELRQLLLAAVADAINYLEDDRVFCPDCRNRPGAVCLVHAEAASLAARYAEIHAQLREAGSGPFPSAGSGRMLGTLADMLECSIEDLVARQVSGAAV